MLNDDLSVSSVSPTHVAVAKEGPPQSSVDEPLSTLDQPAVGVVIRDLSNGVRKAEDLDAQTRQACVRGAGKIRCASPG